MSRRAVSVVTSGPEAVAQLRERFPGVAFFSAYDGNAFCRIGYRPSQSEEVTLGRGATWDRALDNAVRKMARAPLRCIGRKRRGPREGRPFAIAADLFDERGNA